MTNPLHKPKKRLHYRLTNGFRCTDQIVKVDPSDIVFNADAEMVGILEVGLDQWENTGDASAFEELAASVGLGLRPGSSPEFVADLRPIIPVGEVHLNGNRDLAPTVLVDQVAQYAVDGWSAWILLDHDLQVRFVLVMDPDGVVSGWPYAHSPFHALTTKRSRREESETWRVIRGLHFDLCGMDLAPYDLRKR